ncbi:hypothetical protein JCM15519_22600 [Fundidesulfovibrio butyratiphilus]
MSYSHETSIPPHMRAEDDFLGQGFPYDIPVENLRFAPYGDIVKLISLHPDAAYAIDDVDAPSHEEWLFDYGPEPQDDHDRFLWQSAQAVHSLVAQALAQKAQQAHHRRKRAGYHAVVHGLSAHDPLYERTMDVMRHYVSQLSESFRSLVMPRLASHSPSFLAFYKELRLAAEIVENSLHHNRKKRTTHKGKGAHSAEETHRQAKLRDLKALIQRGEATDDDFVRYLDLLGVNP